jgi:hypothetical protein
MEMQTDTLLMDSKIREKAKSSRKRIHRWSMPLASLLSMIAILQWLRSKEAQLNTKALHKKPKRINPVRHWPIFNMSGW